MNIKKSYAEKLIRAGKAVYRCNLDREMNHYCAVIDRLDIQRTDHVQLYFTETLANIGRRKHV